MHPYFLKVEFLNGRIVYWHYKNEESRQRAINTLRRNKDVISMCKARLVSEIEFGEYEEPCHQTKVMYYYNRFF